MINDELTFSKPKNWNSLKLFEKIQYYKNILDQKYSKYVDKLNAKYLVSNIPDLKTALVTKIINHENDFVFSDIKKGFIIKANHGSGWNIFLDEKKKFNDIKNSISSWLNRKYTKYNEKQYEYIEPKIFIEEVIDDYFFGKNHFAVTYMFRCIHGTPQTFSIKRNHLVNSFDINLNLLLPKEHNLMISKDIFERMKKLAKILSENFEFVRIDFYLDKDQNIYFSEFTFSPLCGLQYFDDEIETKLGNLWT